MGARRFGTFKAYVLGGAAGLALATAAFAEEAAADFDIASQDLGQALNEFALQADAEILFAPEVVGGKRTPGVKGEYTNLAALDQLLAGTGLAVREDANGTLLIEPDPLGEGAARSVDGRTLLAQADDARESAPSSGRGREKIIVTGQKREEYIQDVPIAISAFSMEDLNAQKIEGGFDLLKAIPNVSFSKNNFTSYNFSIRGVGTKAVSATTDPGVAVAFNSSTIIQNRLFEQEYYDIERVEVLRGPQGTLYGRNATSGVINVISAKPTLDEFYGQIKGEVGNYDTKRLSATLNVPLKEDVLGVRLAGALTNRDGYDFNTITDNPVNGRDLWSTRFTVGFEPSPRFRANLIWERFAEDDDRLRTGKQLCHRAEPPEFIGSTAIADGATAIVNPEVRGSLFSQGCLPGSLYTDEAFGTPNGLSYNFILATVALRDGFTRVGYDEDDVPQTVIQPVDPYGGLVQSPDLRKIASLKDPRYRADADLIELNFDFDVTDSLLFSSQTAYVDDSVYSFQDYNRFNTIPIFTDTSTLTTGAGDADMTGIAPGGYFCDPQIGCSDTIAGFDISQASAEQFSQELRLQSSFAGPFNFSLGANYTTFDVLVDYYIMFNLITAMASMPPFTTAPASGWDPSVCVFDHVFFDTFAPRTEIPSDDPQSVCPHIDPNPIESLSGEGHNYYRSKNPYELESWAGFGEAYWNLTDTLKFTAGLRYTNDEKTFIPIPTQVLLAPSATAGGTVASGYPEDPPINQKWGEWTGRLVLDWQPDLDFTEETLIYGSYSRGYKGGGANPPKPGFATDEDYQDFIDRGILTESGLAFGLGFNLLPVLQLTAVEYGDTFEPEFVDAYEIGTKNTLLGGGLQVNTTAFYYDYKDYQVSQIRDRTAVNENFDATSWGVELETLFAPSEDFQVIANLGYLDTEIADGETSIDIMNRTQGNPDYVVVKPWVQLPSNCVVPTVVAESWLNGFGNSGLNNYYHLCGGVGGFLGFGASPPDDPNFGNTPYDYNNYPELNGGAGLRADLGGNELPNAPHWTANIGAQYGKDVLDGSWRATVRGDAYWQSNSYHRVYNYEPYDTLKGWYNLNLAVKLERPDDGLAIELYAKNILDDTPITDAFLNSDDTGLTTNVFVLDPRLIGLSLTKEF